MNYLVLFLVGWIFIMEWSTLHCEHLEQYLLFFCREIHGFEPTYSSALLKEICGRYHRDLPRMKSDPDNFKKAAIAIFWIKRYVQSMFWMANHNS